jgi:hypothetical protein
LHDGSAAKQIPAADAAGISVAASEPTRAFSSEVDTGSREENASKPKPDPVLISSEPEKFWPTSKPFL